MNQLIIREAVLSDLQPLLKLYTFLHDNSYPEIDDKINAIWQNILTDKNHHIILGTINEQVVSSCIMIIVPNLTRQQRPYALIENVITHPDFRCRGCATKLLNDAKDKAVQAGCYKIMLMTSAKTGATLNFYKNAGFNAEDKTAFIQWL